MGWDEWMGWDRSQTTRNTRAPGGAKNWTLLKVWVKRETAGMTSVVNDLTFLLCRPYAAWNVQWTLSSVQKKALVSDRRGAPNPLIPDLNNTVLDHCRLSICSYFWLTWKILGIQNHHIRQNHQRKKTDSPELLFSIFLNFPQPKTQFLLQILHNLLRSSLYFTCISQISQIEWPDGLLTNWSVKFLATFIFINCII